MRPNTQTRIPFSKMVRLLLAGVLLYLGAGVEYRYRLFERYVAQEGPRVVQRTPLSNTQVPSNQEVDFTIFWEVWNTILDEHIDSEELTTQEMLDGALAGLVRATKDPYSYYLSPDQFQQSAENMAGRFYGVGIELGYKEGILSVVSPLEDSPAAQAGVEAGDLIINVKDELAGLDEDSSEWPLDRAVQAIRGERGTTVILTLLREGVVEPLEIPIARGEIKIPSLEMEFINQDQKRVAHVQLSQFGQNTSREWNQIVQQILAERPFLDGIVLDVRGNSGGYLNTSVDIASDFYKNGLVVEQKNKYSSKEFRSNGRARLADIPVVVLVNKGSASASEILAGALRDQIGARLVGTQTFGKGTVQDRRELSNGGGVHVTISKWLLPSGESIHESGLAVDEEVEFNPETEVDEQLQRAIEIL